MHIGKIINVYMQWAVAVRHKNTLKHPYYFIQYHDQKAEEEALFQELEKITPVRCMLDFQAPICINEFNELAVTPKT